MLKFYKMHGLGNDFVIFYHEHEYPTPIFTDHQIKQMCDRHLGIGCDQLILVVPDNDNSLKAKVQIYNQDGSQAQACGNAFRCVGHLMQLKSQDIRDEEAVFELHTSIGQKIEVRKKEDSIYTAILPSAKVGGVDCSSVAIENLGTACYVDMGNPHLVFDVVDLKDIDIGHWGPKIEHLSLFPERINVGFAQVRSENHIDLIVWERGAGLTHSCGTGACAAVSALTKAGKVKDQVKVSFPIGNLWIEDLAEQGILMTGPVEFVFEGFLSKSYFN